MEVVPSVVPVGTAVTVHHTLRTSGNTTNAERAFMDATQLSPGMARLGCVGPEIFEPPKLQRKGHVTAAN